MISVIDGEVDRALGAGEKQVRLLRVFADHIHGPHRVETLDDMGPGRSAIVGAIDVWSHVVTTDGIDGDVGRLRIEVPSIHLGDFVPGA